MTKLAPIPLLALLLAACGSSPKPAATPTAAPIVATATPAPLPTATPELASYTVQAGDTLTSIAAKTNRSVAAIRDQNNLTDPNKLTVGQKLLLPPLPPGASAAGQSSASAGADGRPQASATRPPPP